MIVESIQIKVAQINSILNIARYTLETQRMKAAQIICVVLYLENSTMAAVWL